MKTRVCLKYFMSDCRDLTARADSNTTLTIYYAFNVLPPLTLFLSQYGIHTKRYFLWINCLYV